MSTDDTPVNSIIPTTRAIQRPYFLLTTSDGVGHYLKEERPGMNSVNQTLFSRREPLVEFLAPAVIKRIETSGASGRKQYQIDYSIEDTIQQSAVPMEAVPDALINQFQEAAGSFLGLQGDRRFAPHEKGLRDSFRVPDPDLEPDCYWLYGTPGNRKLLILWGCEKKEKTAIPLMPDPRSPGKNLLDWLKAHRMDWRGRQKEMVRLLKSGNQPLKEFIATPVNDRKGGLKGYTIGSKDYPAKLLRKARHVPAAQVEAFASAAAQFYADAAPDSETLSAAEKELRLAFMLPDPEQRPETLLRMGKRFAIALPDGLEESECLHLCEDEELGIPPATTNADGASVVPSTLLEKLRERITPVKLYAALSAVAAVLMIAGLTTLYMLSDRTPPTVERVIAENDPKQIIVIFDEKVSAGSLSPRADEDPVFRIRAVSGKVHQVVGAELHAENAAKAILAVSPPLEDAGEYNLLVQGVVDTAFHRNRMEEQESHQFVWYDRLPPKLMEISAEGTDQNQLLLFFNKPLERASATRTVNYRIQGFRILNADFYQEDNSIVVISAERDARTAGPNAETGFLHMGEYELEISSIRDATESKNPIEDTIRQSFIFRDTVPPRVREVNATENQWTVRVQFSEGLDEASAQNTSNYTVTTDEGERISVLGAELAADGSSVKLTTEPMYPNINYTLGVRGVRDRSPERNEMVEREDKAFHYRGPMDETPPMIEEIRVSDDRTDLTVIFNESVNVATAEISDHYRIAESNVSILSARRLGTDDRRFQLRLSDALPQASRLLLEVTGVEDRVGNKTEAASLPFQTPGVLWLDATLQASGAEAPSPTRLRLIFNERLTPASASRLENYRLPERYTIERISYDNEKTVTLELSPDAPLDPGRFNIEARNMRLFVEPDNPQATVRFNVDIR